VSDTDDSTFDDRQLMQLVKALKGEMPRARVGILGQKTIRRGADSEKETVSVNINLNQKKLGFKQGAVSTNAAVGAVHEFGTEHIPQRSFLRVPISEHLPKRMEEAGAFNPETIKEVLKEGSVKPWLETIAAMAKGIVIEAFATGGFGKWVAWQTPGYENNTGQLLKDTQQLSESITWEVK